MRLLEDIAINLKNKKYKIERFALEKMQIFYQIKYNVNQYFTASIVQSEDGSIGVIIYNRAVNRYRHQGLEINTDNLTKDDVDDIVKLIEHYVHDAVKSKKYLNDMQAYEVYKNYEDINIEADDANSENNTKIFERYGWWFVKPKILFTVFSDQEEDYEDDDEEYSYDNEEDYEDDDSKYYNDLEDDDQ